MVQPATNETFDEELYLRSNPDVAIAVQQKKFRSGRHHFERHGEAEGRLQRVPHSEFSEYKRRKLDRIEALLDPSSIVDRGTQLIDCLADEAKRRHGLEGAEMDVPSSHGYDTNTWSLVERHENGWVLDIGAGWRPICFDHVINLEIFPYDTTDVLAVAERLPFRDGSLDAVICIAVLEHVKDPFRCASEICRVLKPGGELYCCVPFLQPLHGYPHHYYNMTHQGLKNLFDDSLTVERMEVLDSTAPAHAISWILRRWADGLEGRTRKRFMRMRVRDLMEAPEHLVRQPFSRELSEEKRFELASACVIHAHKPGDPPA